MNDKIYKIYYSAILIPGKIDSSGNSLDKKSIQKCMELFLDGKYYTDIKLENIPLSKDSKIVIIESFILKRKNKKFNFPSGSWIIGFRIEQNNNIKEL